MLQRIISIVKLRLNVEGNFQKKGAVFLNNILFTAVAFSRNIITKDDDASKSPTGDKILYRAGKAECPLMPDIRCTGYENEEDYAHQNTSKIIIEVSGFVCFVFKYW